MSISTTEVVNRAVLLLVSAHRDIVRNGGNAHERGVRWSGRYVLQGVLRVGGKREVSLVRREIRKWLEYYRKYDGGAVLREKGVAS